MDVKISAFVVARDEEERIERCLRSVAWAEERLVVVDSATRDATAEKARPLATDVVVPVCDRPPLPSSAVPVSLTMLTLVKCGRSNACSRVLSPSSAAVCV